MNYFCFYRLFIFISVASRVLGTDMWFRIYLRSESANIKCNYTSKNTAFSKPDCEITWNFLIGLIQSLYIPWPSNGFSMKFFGQKRPWIAWINLSFFRCGLRYRKGIPEQVHGTASVWSTVLSRMGKGRERVGEGGEWDRDGRGEKERCQFSFKVLMTIYFASRDVVNPTIKIFIYKLDIFC